MSSVVTHWREVSDKFAMSKTSTLRAHIPKKSSTVKFPKIVYTHDIYVCMYKYKFLYIRMQVFLNVSYFLLSFVSDFNTVCDTVWEGKFTP